ncbi:feather keratin-like isoform X3 [Phaenicophaeus curvirostris]|uniref:feather keratin-like isoform X3 n=1 Tax=Phaenicophaeus curvirostris TaxID=33595 RepID=UPI0037F096C6
MACNDLCRPCAPAPLANSCNEPCVRQCQDSSVVIQPPTVQVTLPGPILTSFPQSTAVGSSASAAVGSELSYQGVPISNGAFGYGYGLGGLGCYGGRGLGWFGGRSGCYPC